MNYDTFDTYTALIGGVEAAYHRLLSGDTTPGLLDVVARDPKWAFVYARDFIQGRWPMGETAIAQDPRWAYEYALEIIQARWPVAEPVIAQNTFWAYEYARYVIKGPWPEAEPAIARSSYHNDYLMNLVNTID